MFHRSRARQVAFGRQVLCCLLLSLLASSPAWAFDPLAGDFSKEHPLDVRIVEYNHERNFISDPSRDAAFNRILIALNPDVICFEEFESSVSSTAIRDRLDSILPIDGGGNWQIHLGLLGGIRTVIASRYPLTMKRVDTIPASSTRGVTIALVDLPESNYDRDIYLLGVHLKCCGSPGSSEDDSRQDSADAIANWLGDARGVSRPFGDNVELPADTPMISLGDFNLVGGPQPEDTLLTGDIQSESTYGPDVKGDWDISDMTDLHPVDPFTGDDFTWQGSSSYAPSRLDRFFYTDSVVTIANSFILNSDTMTSSALAAAGLQSSDTLPSRSADHLPMVADLRLVTVGECTIDADCDDGEFCNGAEYCNASQICRPGIEPCTGQLCRETDDICVDCLADADCADDLFCNGVEVCDASGSCQPGDDPCPGEMCDEPNAQCVECFVDADCDDGNPCTGEERCTAAGFCEDGPCHETVTVVDADFNIDAGDFVYVDDVFGTSNASKADGSHELAGGFDGGGLRIFLGPGSASGALSGGWPRDFTFPESSTVTVSLRYRLLLGAGYETSEYGEAVLEIDGTRYGADANDALAHLTGDGNGGVNTDTGWVMESFEIPLTAGAHTMTVGSYNNQATASDEWVQCLFDDILVTVETTVECTCDDGVFCNGAEHCAGDACVSDASPCLANEWCDESASQCVMHGSGDFDVDGDIDLRDFAAFQACFGATADEACRPGNLTGLNADIDSADFGAFAAELTGP